MAVLPKILNCRHKWCHLLNISGPKFNLKSNFFSAFSLNYGTLASEISYTESSDSYADNFGSLRNTNQLSKFKAKDISKKGDNFKVVKMKHRPNYNQYKEANVFGNLSDKSPIWYPDIMEDSIADNDLSDDSNIVLNISKKFRCPKLYLERMKLLVAEKKLKEALELFLDMRRNFVSPTHGHYTFMIGACGRFGYTEMAFKLFRQMTDRKLVPSPATLTGLFNSCGESPFPEYGLKKALRLKDKIKEKNWIVTQITYHAMIKAFGKCGDIQTAFQVVDEMAKDDIRINVDTYSFLLMSCIANKEAGFTHAIEVWRKMKERRCKPSIYAFNLLLRAARDCEIGPKEISCQLLQHWSSFPTRPYAFERKETFQKEKELLRIESVKMVDILPETSCDQQEDLRITEDSDSPVTESMSKSLQKKADMNSAIVNASSMPQSVLSARPAKGVEVLELGNIKTSSDRLALIGNAAGFLLDMKKNRVKPDIKTFTLLLECLPPRTVNEEELISLLDVYNVKPDVGFFNILIKRRSFRFDYNEASKVLLLINKWSLSPDIITYGVLALGCFTHEKATTFINDMRKLGLSPNTEIVGSLLSAACKSVDFDYLEDTLHFMEMEGMEPNERMLLKLEATVKNIRKNIFDMENGKPVPNVYKREGFSRRYKEFCEKYDKWLKNIRMGKEEHVWSQYKTAIF